ncbi:MAG: aspartate aminotransferase family protein, partial [Thermoanaerobaculia bacterium]|nr:aspartate aminotransferase family protein [Thermoanaerobaculia bacterium]
MPPGESMTPEELRRLGRELVDWIADYMERVEERSVLSAVEPGEIRSGLPDRAPEEGEPFEAMLRDVE